MMRRRGKPTDKRDWGRIRSESKPQRKHDKSEKHDRTPSKLIGDYPVGVSLFVIIILLILAFLNSQ